MEWRCGCWKCDILVRRFDEYFEQRENITILHQQFLTLVQERPEMVNEYMRAQKAGEIMSPRGHRVIHVVLKGLRNEKLISELLRMAELNRIR